MAGCIVWADDGIQVSQDTSARVFFYSRESLHDQKMPHRIEPLYRALIGKTARAAARDLMGDDISARLAALAFASHAYLSSTHQTPLVSKVQGKNYFMFRDIERGKTSRPVNSALYQNDLRSDLVKRVLDCDIEGLTAETITKIVYTIAIGYCCTADLLKKSDQKTPGTFFEFLIGHLVARRLGVNPKTQIQTPTLNMSITLPTDFIFDLGPEKSKVHLPIKTSTRERAVQVWAHQRVLDGMHGTGRFKGVLVALAETNKQKDVSVVEVCLPNQWTAYQMYISQIFRVYYLDPPEKYMSLGAIYPPIHVKEFGNFFFEIAAITQIG